MLFCFFEYWYICVLHLIFFEIFVSEIIYFIHQIVVIVQSVQSVWHLLLLKNNLFVLARRTTAIVLWVKPFGCQKLLKEILNSLAHVSLYFALLNLKFSKWIKGVVSKETVVLPRWGSSTQKFGFISGVDNVNWPPYRDSKSRRFERLPFVRANRGIMGCV